MSGGVDSSVAAALLKEQGHDVIGMMMRLWSEAGKEASNRCCTPDSMASARRVAARLGIPFYAVDAQRFFYNHVVSSFFQGYRSGITPNPCLACNREVRWGFLLDRARSLGASFMATGHYCRLVRDSNGNTRLLRGVDSAKDQSYVLYMLDQKRLSQAMFPLGDLKKDQVRALAQKFDLPVYARSDSQDLCFLAGGNYRDFLHRNAPDTEVPGPILNAEGEQIGEHRGLAFYTIGQRKGLGISASQPLYVKDKQVSHNALIVAHRDELGQSSFQVGQVNWIAGQPPENDIEVAVKIRYRARDALADVVATDGSNAEVHLQTPLRDITPGQAAVFYHGDICLGGGIIQ
jgi:tRNA-specific 2-thiouridylase